MVFFTLIAMLITSTATSTAQAEEAPQHVIATVLGKEITAKQKQQLNSIIFGCLFEKFAQDNKVTVSDAEVKKMMLWIDVSIRLQRIEFEEKKASLLKDLQSAELDKEKRQEMEKQLELYKQLIKAERESIQQEADMGEAEQKAAQQFKRQMCHDFVLQWKTNLALFNRYGGRVLFQQGGLEPIDAYRDYLQEQEKSGAFQIINSGDRSSFWSYFLEPSQHFLLEEEEASQAIRTPIWQQKHSE